MQTTIINKADTLNRFRKHWTGRRILSLIRNNGGRVLINWPIGVGKSRNLDDLIEAAFRSSQYDLVIVLLPTRRVLDERRLVRNPPPNINIVNLRPRPHQSCGEDLDRQWQLFESRGMGLLGRVRLCRPCPSFRQCFWPHQYGGALHGAQIIFATQVHLERDPTFITQLRLWTGARRVLTILDEANFIAKSMRRRIKREHIQQFISVLGGRENDDS
jgi:hypothetical protein